MKILSVNDPAFRPYGRVVEGFDTAELEKAMLETPQPDSVLYEASVPALEALPIFAEFRDKLYGGMPIQVGFCNGDNHKLNCVEYHRDSEFNLACTDMIVLVGRQQDIKPDSFRYDTGKIEAFLVPKGTLIEFYATTLHYAPVSATGKFRCVVVLPRGTNAPLPFAKVSEGEARLLTHQNKWLIAHPEADEAKDGAHVGLVGENITL
ncbi:MAG TPA: DUF4867 family protein [Candidatus Pullichristensenella excrementigallinarum]|uniref:DUF4867 family protein n=1 Tax=Candidatus Pullichristensenella excrementigallinarum TaxID=2840907 RepID=A0A9D1LAC7_9FIRM|nr:DUF4867 family protein [Candidatus Pullichristensenella excrementigallinarum]